MGWMDRVLSWIGFEVEAVDEEAAALDEGARSERQERRRSRVERTTAAGSIVALPGNTGPMRVVIITPRHFNDVQSVADHLKSRRPVIVNLESSDRDLSQRILNFLSGTIYALNGEMHRVGSNVVFFAPGGVEVSVEGRPARNITSGDQPAGGLGRSRSE